MSRRIAILQSNYIPWKGYFDIIDSVDVFVVYDIVQYTKNGWRNRNYVMARNDKQWLTIPVRHSTRLAVNQICVSDRYWWKKHLKTLEQLYAKAAYFELYHSRIKALYQQLAEQPLLSHINLSFIKLINEFLGIATEIRQAEELDCSGDRNERLVAICRQLRGDLYVSGPAAQSYLDTAIFDDHGIAVKWYCYGDYPEYRQLGNTFDHAVSVLDLIFNEGPDARQFMRPDK